MRQYPSLPGIIAVRKTIQIRQVWNILEAEPLTCATPDVDTKRFNTTFQILSTFASSQTLGMPSHQEQECRHKQTLLFGVDFTEMLTTRKSLKHKGAVSLQLTVSKTSMQLLLSCAKLNKEGKTVGPNRAHHPNTVTPVECGWIQNFTQKKQSKPSRKIRSRRTHSHLFLEEEKGCNHTRNQIISLVENKKIELSGLL